MLHFIYRIPPSDTMPVRLIERVQRSIIHRSNHLLPTTWRKGSNFSRQYRQRAPYSITVNLYQKLSGRYEVKLYDLQERGIIKYSSDDIILGHPWPRQYSVTNKAILNPRRCKLKALIFPLHHGIPEINYYALPYMEKADLIFGIMGPYWYDTLDASIFAQWKPKIVPLDMAIDIELFPYVKTTFNPPGKRGYLYIGRNSVEKGTHILSETMAGLQGYKRGWIGSGDDIPNVPREEYYSDLTPEYVGYLSQKYDFFVNTSISDANPTTILEAMAWGFPVACTPESGYYNQSTIISLSTKNISQNIETLIGLQDFSEEKLIALSQSNRRLVQNKYTWDRFSDTVLTNIERNLESLS